MLAAQLLQRVNSTQSRLQSNRGRGKTTPHLRCANRVRRYGRQRAKLASGDLVDNLGVCTAAATKNSTVMNRRGQTHDRQLRTVRHLF